MATASYIKKLQVSADNSTWSDLPATSCNLNINADELDTTVIGTNGGYHDMMAGLLNWDLDATVLNETSDTAINAVRTSLLTRSDLYARYMPTGLTTVGYSGKVMVSSINTSGDVAGLEELSISLKGRGALAPLS